VKEFHKTIALILPAMGGLREMEK